MRLWWKTGLYQNAWRLHRKASLVMFCPSIGVELHTCFPQGGHLTGRLYRSHRWMRASAAALDHQQPGRRVLTTLTEVAKSAVPFIGLIEVWGAGFGGHLDGRLSGTRRQPGPLQQRWTISDFVEAYTKGLTTPAEVAERIISLIWEQDSCTPPMRMMLAHLPHHLRQHAAASTERCVSSCLAQQPLSFQ